MGVWGGGVLANLVAAPEQRRGKEGQNGGPREPPPRLPIVRGQQPPQQHGPGWGLESCVRGRLRGAQRLKDRLARRGGRPRVPPQCPQRPLQPAPPAPRPHSTPRGPEAPPFLSLPPHPLREFGASRTARAPGGLEVSLMNQRCLKRGAAKVDSGAGCEELFWAQRAGEIESAVLAPAALALVEAVGGGGVGGGRVVVVPVYGWAVRAAVSEVL